MKAYHALNINTKVNFVLEHNVSSTSKTNTDASWTPICWVGVITFDKTIKAFKRCWGYISWKLLTHLWTDLCTQIKYLVDLLVIWVNFNSSMDKCTVKSGVELRLRIHTSIDAITYLCWLSKESLLSICTPRSFSISGKSISCAPILWFTIWSLFILLSSFMTLHLSGWNFSSHVLDHLTILSISFCRIFLSSSDFTSRKTLVSSANRYK